MVNKRGQKDSLNQQQADEVWMDKDGNKCSPEDSFGCRVKYRLLHPNQCFVGDKVVDNMSLKGDGHVRGKLLLAVPKSVSYDRVSVTENSFTFIGHTVIDGGPVICNLIIQ